MSDHNPYNDPKKIFEQCSLDTDTGFILLDRPCPECMDSWTERNSDTTCSRLKKEYVGKYCVACHCRRFLITSTGEQLLDFIKRHHG